MLTLHIANKNYSSWSLRPWVLMRSLNLPFEEKLSPFQPESNWDEFREFSPNGLVPSLVDDEVVVWDSLSIIEYLAESHPEVWPNDRVARAWARSASAEMHSGFGTLREMCTMNCGIRAKLHEIPAPLERDIQRIDEIWSEGMTKFGGPFLAGERFTAVDAFYAPVVIRVNSYNLRLSQISKEYVSMMLNQTAMQQWFNAALEEPWREPGHEQDILRYADIMEDNRVTQ